MKLKKCPFCGAEAIMQTFQVAGEKGERYRAKCSACWCETDWDNYTAEDCAEKWNRRADDV